MGKKTDLRKKRRLSRFLKRKKVEREELASQRKVDELERSAELEAKSIFSSPDTYGAAFGIVLSIIFIMDWAALKLFNFETLHQFGLFKSAAFYILYAVVVMTSVAKQKEKDWGTTLFGLSVLTAPLIIIVNTVLSGQHEQGIGNMLLSASVSALTISVLSYVVHVTAKLSYNGLWIVVGYTILCPVTLLFYGESVQQPPSEFTLVGAIVLGVVLGWRWAVSRTELPRNVLAIVLSIITAHIYALLACIAIATNLWVILFS